MTLWASLRLEGVERPALWLLFLAGAGWLLWVTYQRMFARSGDNLAWILLGLRVAGLLALVLVLAKPTWTEERAEVDPGRVAIVLDTSASMALMDTAQASRFERATAATKDLTKTLARIQGPSTRAEVFDLKGNDLSGGIPAQPTLERTDLARGVTEAVARLRSRPLTAVVLISDGMDNSGRADFQELGDIPVPTFTVGFPQRSEQRAEDWAIRKVNAPTRRAIVHNEVLAEVLVSKTGGAATTAKVTIQRGDEIFATKEVSLPTGGNEQWARLTFTPRTPGNYVFTAHVTAGAGEKLLSNNSRHFPLHVDKDPIRVFYLEGFLRHEYKFLKRRLEDDPDISLITIARAGNPQFAGATAGEYFTSEKLQKFDVVILGDLEANYLAEAEYQALLKWLDGNHGLLVLGGYHSFGPRGLRATPLADALPVVLSDQEPFQIEEPFLFELTPEGQRHPIFEASGDRVNDTALWNAAPPLLGCCLVQRAKPGATVLAVNSKHKIEDRPLPVFSVQRFGGSQVMVFTADTTWRWQRIPRVQGKSDTVYGRFWSQTIRWLAGRERDDKNIPLLVSTDRPDYEVGKPVQVRVQRVAGADDATAELAVEVVPEADAAKAVTVRMRANSNQPDLFTGTFFPSSGGRYEARAALVSNGNPIANQTSEFLVQGTGLELADTATNPQNLQTISNRSGGNYFDIDEIDRLANTLPRKERKILKISRTEYWNSPGLFLFFLLAVSAEWLLRRRHHLV